MSDPGPSIAAQTASVAYAWAYTMLFLMAAPFFAAPPLWIAALSMRPEKSGAAVAAHEPIDE
jgi:hypothetical protein